MSEQIPNPGHETPEGDLSPERRDDQPKIENEYLGKDVVIQIRDHVQEILSDY